MTRTGGPLASNSSPYTYDDWERMYEAEQRVSRRKPVGIDTSDGNSIDRLLLSR